MWTKARCLAQLEPRLPSSFTVEAAFKRPILLPGKVEFASDADAAGAIAFAVRDPTGTPHLAGRVTPRCRAAANARLWDASCRSAGLEAEAGS